MENLRQNVIDKILKLMAKTIERGATEAEAIQAALIAQKMMNDYNIEQSELHAEEEELIINRVCEISSDKSFYKQLAAVIAPNFRCKVYTSPNGPRKSVVHFYGYERDTEAANIIFQHLYTLGNRIANRKCREAKKIYHTARGVYNSFAMGFITGVKQELEKQSRALLVITPKEVEDQFEDDFKDTNWRSNRAMSVRYNDFHSSTYEEGRRAAIDGIRSRRIEGRLGLESGN